MTVARPSNQTPQRVKDFRVTEWRKWAAKELMAKPERNRRVMIALARCGHTGDVRSIEFGAAAKRIAGPCVLERLDFAVALPEADAIDAQHLEQLMLAVTASAAFGVGQRDLEALLNYLEVDEGRHFKWNTEFLELFTLSELESLAGEVGLKAKMGRPSSWRGRRRRAISSNRYLPCRGLLTKAPCPPSCNTRAAPFPQRPSIWQATNSPLCRSNLRKKKPSLPERCNHWKTPNAFVAWSRRNFFFEGA